MSRVTAKTVATAQLKLEQATAWVLRQAATFPREPTQGDIAGMLSASREYGRALDRVSRVRVKT